MIPEQSERIKNIKNGRPPKYDEEKHLELLDDIIGQKGEGVDAFCAVAMICESTFYEWVKVHPKFREAYSRSRSIARARWWKIAEKQVEGFNYQFWDKAYKNKFGRDFTKKQVASNIKKAKSFKEKTNAIWDSIATGEISLDDAARLNNMITEQYKIEGILELKAEFEKFKEEHQKESTDAHNDATP